MDASGLEGRDPDPHPNSRKKHTMITTNGIQEMLSTIPIFMGFTPEESVLIVTLAENDTIDAMVRADLPAADMPPTEFVDMIGNPLKQTGTKRFILVLYTGEEWTGTYPPHSLFAGALAGALEAKAEASCLTTAVVTPSEWANYFTMERGPRLEAEFSVAAAQLVASDNRRPSYITIPEPVHDPAFRDKVLRRVTLLGIGDQDFDHAEVEFMTETVRDLYVRDTPATQEELALICAMACNTTLRDALMVLTALEEWDPVQARGLTGIMFGMHVDIFDKEVHQRASGIIYEALKVAPEPSRPGLLVTLGWMQWVVGMSKSGHDYMAAALEAEPGYRFAELFDEFIASGKVSSIAADRTIWMRK